VTALTVAGIGSHCAGDDAVGLALVAAMPPLPGVVYEQWADTDALDLAHRLLQSPAPVLAVDCAEMGLAPGEWRCIRLHPVAEARLRLRSRSVSTHGLGLAEALAIAEQLGLATPVQVFGIQPYRLAIGGLSEAMQACLPRLQQALADETTKLIQVKQDCAQEA